MPTIPLIESIKQHILTPIVSLLFALALVYFLYGMVQFLWQSDSNTAKQEGVQHMLWGVIGMGIMVAVYGIMNLICRTIGCA